jgi:ATP-binding cassette subfamily B protein RaxB
VEIEVADLSLKNEAFLQQAAGRPFSLSMIDRRRLYDPALGRRTVTHKDFSRMFTGVAIEFERTAGVLRPHSSQTLTWRSFFRKVTGIRGDVIAIVVGALLLELLQVLAPFYLQLTVDWVLTSGDVGVRKALLLAFALALVITILVSAMRTEVILRLRSRLHRAWLIDTFSTCSGCRQASSNAGTWAILRRASMAFRTFKNF